MELIEKSLQINEQSMEIIRIIGKSLESLENHWNSKEMIEKSMETNEQSMQTIRIIEKSLKINGTDWKIIAKSMNNQWESLKSLENH